MLKNTLLVGTMLGALAGSLAVSAAAEPAEADTTVVQQQSVNINTASAAELAAALTGVGQARAEAIVELRDELGGFTDVEQLLEIRGLGIRILNRNRDRMTL